MMYGRTARDTYQAPATTAIRNMAAHSRTQVTTFARVEPKTVEIVCIPALLSYSISPEEE
jgi:hypothetical protein